MTSYRAIAAIIVIVLVGWLVTLVLPGGDLSHPLTTK